MLRRARRPRGRCGRPASGCTSGPRRGPRARRRGRSSPFPATGWPGTKRRGSRCGPTRPMTGALTEPTSVTMASGPSAGAMARATSPIAPTGTASTTRSAPSTAARGSVVASSTRPSSSARRAVAAQRSSATVRRARRRRRRSRASEPPTSPMPTTATRSKRTTGVRAGPRGASPSSAGGSSTSACAWAPSLMRHPPVRWPRPRERAGP